MVDRDQYIEELESALLDLLDGKCSYLVRDANTDLSITRCVEIEDLYKEVKEKYNKKHNIIE
ncbi:MAG: hypothetical protein M0R17_01975 [Candidatus Omnitrophica bacterium]|jgi:hypothetical protein|nr:hypothetical protein [Candidatus Omnitrophota bacterium]